MLYLPKYRYIPFTSSQLFIYNDFLLLFLSNVLYTVTTNKKQFLKKLKYMNNNAYYFHQNYNNIPNLMLDKIMMTRRGTREKTVLVELLVIFIELHVTIDVEQVRARSHFVCSCLQLPIAFKMQRKHVRSRHSV